MIETSIPKKENKENLDDMIKKETLLMLKEQYIEFETNLREIHDKQILVTCKLSSYRNILNSYESDKKYLDFYQYVADRYDSAPFCDVEPELRSINRRTKEISKQIEIADFMLSILSDRETELKKHMNNIEEEIQKIAPSPKKKIDCPSDDTILKALDAAFGHDESIRKLNRGTFIFILMCAAMILFLFGAICVDFYLFSFLEVLTVMGEILLILKDIV